jgi:hypothetical protein
MDQKEIGDLEWIVKSHTDEREEGVRELPIYWLSSKDHRSDHSDEGCWCKSSKILAPRTS